MLVALCVLAFGFAAVTQTVLLLPALAIASGVVALSGMPLAKLAHRLRWPGVAILSIVVLLPFAAGETVLWQAGWLRLHTEGLEAAALIAVRFVCIVSVATALLGSRPTTETIQAMRALGLPWLIADLALLVVRYLGELSRDLERMRLAMRLRGMGEGLSLRLLRGTGWLIASLLLRSHERAERVYAAMRLRGYGAETMSEHGVRPGARDLIALLGVITLVGLLLGAEFTS